MSLFESIYQEELPARAKLVYMYLKGPGQQGGPVLALRPDHWEGPGPLPLHRQAGHPGAGAEWPAYQAGQKAGEPWGYLESISNWIEKVSVKSPGA